MSDKHHDKSPGHSQESAASDRLRHDDHQTAGNQTSEKHDGFRLKPVLEDIDDGLNKLKKLSPFYKPDAGLVGPGCHKVDMLHDKPTKTNELLKDKANDSYNCKYYVKTFMDGKAPVGDRGQHEELSSQDLTSRGYEKAEGKGFYKPGDIILVLPNPGVSTLSPVVHAAVVTEVGPGGKGVMITQKPDGEHPVTRTDLAAFCQFYNITSKQCHIEVYRNNKKPIKL